MRPRCRAGIPPFDERFGGIFRGRAVLCVGERESGKTLAALQFAAQGLRGHERVLILSEHPCETLLELSTAMRFGLSEAMRQEQAFLLGPDIVTPGFQDVHFEPLQRLVETHRIQRLVIDTVIPWIPIRDVGDIQPHVNEFIRHVEDMRTTTFLTMPWPTKPDGVCLADALRTQVPIDFMLCRQADERRILDVRRFLGENGAMPKVALAILPGTGLVLSR